MSGEDLSSEYNTELSEKEESQFNSWAKKQSALRGRDILSDMKDYDLKGYYKSEGKNFKGIGHMPDTYKKPNHPTFSSESQYHSESQPGGEWNQLSKGRWSFTPSEKMINSPEKIKSLKQYFSENERGSVLNIPEGR